MNHDGPSVWRVEELDLSYEAQQSGGVAGDAVVGPAGEVKLTEFTDLMVTLLKHRRLPVREDSLLWTRTVAAVLVKTNASISREDISWFPESGVHSGSSASHGK